MRIWLDDLRDPADYGYPDAVWVKNEIDFKLLFIDCLISDDGNTIEAIHFDNDLGEQTEGYDIFLEIEEFVHKGKLRGLRSIYVHTSNPAAAQKFMLARDALARYDVDMIRKNY